MTKTRKPKPEATTSDVSVNFGNVESLKLKLLNDISKTLHRIEELLDGRSK
jgi:hypothetical protein